MSSVVITFDEMERNFEEAKAWTLLAKNARHAIISVLLTTFVSRALKVLISSLSAEHIEQLSSEDTITLTKQLQDVHCLLVTFCRLPSRRFVTNTLVRKIQDSTEELGDIIDDLVLSQNDQFKLLVSECARDVSAAAHSGRM